VIHGLDPCQSHRRGGGKEWEGNETTSILENVWTLQGTNVTEGAAGMWGQWVWGGDGLGVEGSGLQGSCSLFPDKGKQTGELEQIIWEVRSKPANW